jgi:hypothetical protein
MNARERRLEESGGAGVTDAGAAKSPADGGRQLDEVLGLAAQHADLPIEAVFKEDLLRRGVTFTPEALQLTARTKPKAYFIFSFDMVSLDELGDAASLHAPEEIALVGGPHALRRTIVSVRLNPSSPYRVEADGERLKLCSGTETLCDVKLGPRPGYYEQQLASGKSMREVAPTIEWGYLIYLTVFRLCQYFGAEEECKFCDINENFRQQRRAGRPYTQVKDLDDILQALALIDTAERRDTAAPRAGSSQESDNGLTLPLLPTTAYTLTGGSITSQLQGLSEMDFYCRYAEAIEARFPGRWIGKAVVQAHEVDAVRRLQEAGVQIYHPNYEVWDAQLFSILCPGKQRSIGRDTWIRRILEAAKIMGPAQVIPNFVAGIEMARPWGFESVDDALRSTGEGLDFFMSHGVVPRFTTWCPEKLSDLGRDQGPAPLAYHLGLLRLWRDTHRKYGLPVPRGYGDPGVGKAVFSVSSFMDVIEAA